MINARDPQSDPDVTKLPCRIGTGDCEDLADGYCEECGKATCRSCAVEIQGGLLLCADCQSDIETAASKDQQEKAGCMTLDDKGRCCGRKPLVYKSRNSTTEGPQRYCPRCDRAYNLEENYQIPNWAYKPLPDGSWKRQTTGKVSA